MSPTCTALGCSTRTGSEPRLLSALRLLAMATPYFDFYSFQIAGTSNGAKRARIMAVLTGQKMPIAKCGITALRAAFFEAMGIADVFGAAEEFKLRAADMIGTADALRAEVGSVGK